MSNEVTDLVVITDEQKDLVRRTIAPDATDAELSLFFYDCTRRGVHPLDKLIHFTKRSGKYTPITSIDMFRMRAAESGEHMGTDDAVYTGDAGKPEFAASVTVYRRSQGEKCSYTATARWSEYFPGEQQGFMWKKMPHLMLAKCAEALALRKAFPQQLHGLYTPEEMAQAERPNIPQVRPRSDATMIEPPVDKYTGEQLDGIVQKVKEAWTPRQEDNGPKATDAGSPASGDAPAPSRAAEYCRQQAESAPEQVDVPMPKFTFGKHRGKAINDPSVPDDYLAWIEPRIVEWVNDPGRLQYKHDNQALLDAVRSELIERNAMPLDT